MALFSVYCSVLNAGEVLMFGRSPFHIRFNFATALICLVCVLYSTDSIAGWQRIATFSRLVGAGYFFNAQRGIITVDGDFGDVFSGVPSAPPQIWRTYNGGLTWLQSVVPPGYTGTSFNDVFMKDSLNGWVVFEVEYSNQNMWRTTNGGVTWFEVNGVVEEATSVYETSKGVLYTHRGLQPGDDQGIFVSRDNGASFGKLQNMAFNGLDFVDDDHGVASTFDSITLFTNNGGDSWFPTSQRTEAWGVYGEKGTSNFVIAGEQRAGSPSTFTTIVRSSDFGLTWGNLVALPFRNTGHIEGVGKTIYIQVDFNFINNQGLFRTTDGGFSWKNVGGPSHLRDTRFCVVGCNGAVVYAFDPFGNVYKTIDGGDGLLQEEIDNLVFTKTALSCTADVCSNDDDSVRLINTTCYPMTITDVDFSNSVDEVVTSGALSFLFKPTLPLTLQPGQSAPVRIKWDPVKSSQSLPSSSQYVKFTSLSQTGFGSFDTLVPIVASSVAQKLIANLDSSAYSLAPTDFCAYRDTLIHVRNPGCDTMYLTNAIFDNITNWRILTADGQDNPLTLPLIIPPGSQITIKVRFIPTKTGYETGNMAIQLIQRNTRVDTTLFMQASSFRSGTISTVEMVDFGSISSCVISDTTVTYTNQTCEELIIDWVDLQPLGAFTLVNPPSFPMVLKPDSTLTLEIRYFPTKYLFENAQLELHATATGDPISIPIFLFGLGTPGTSQYIASIDDTPLVFTPTDFCGIGDTLSFSIKNPGCDSLVVEDVVQLSSSSGIFSYKTSSTIPKLILGAGDSLAITLFCIPTSIGDHNASFRVRFRLADGSIFDTVYTMSFSVSRGPRTLSILPTSIDFGTLPLCIEEDSSITITNTGCADITLDSLKLSESHYSFLSITSYPYILPRGGSVNIPVRYSSPTPGAFAGDITLWSNADTLPIRIIPVSGATIDKDYLTLSMVNLAGKPHAGDTIQIAVVPDRDWIGEGVKDVSFRVRYNSNLLTHWHTDEPPATTLKEVYTQLKPDEGSIEFTISSDYEVRFEKNQPVAVIKMITAMTDTLYTPLTLSDIKINGNDQYYRNCILGTFERSEGFTLYLECGEGPLKYFLAGQPILFVSHPTPNPLTQTSGYRLQLPITSSVDAQAEVRLVDMSGIERSSISLGKLSKGINNLSIDLTGYDSGIYQYLLSLKDFDHIPITGKIVIIK